jgi:hypothetical protein
VSDAADHNDIEATASIERSLLNHRLDRLAQFWWIRLPLAVQRVSVGTTVTLLDGLYLAIWPRVAAMLPLLALISGLLIGWRHWGFNVVFTESLVVMLLATTFGIISAHLGLLFVCGFAFGDFFLAVTIWRCYSGFNYLTGMCSDGFIQHLARVRLPLLIEYGLLGLLTTQIPMLTKALLVQLVPPSHLRRSVRLGLAVVGQAALTGILVYLWTRAMPILIRPIFLWRGTNPFDQAIAMLRTPGMILVFVAIVASIVRTMLHGMIVFRPHLGVRLDAIQNQLNLPPPISPITAQVNPWIRTVGQSLWSTLLLTGMIFFWYDAVLLGGLIFLLQAARTRLIPLPLGPWARLVQRIPLLVRMAGGIIVVYYLSRSFLEAQMRVTSSFRPIVLLTGVALVVFFLLNPGLLGEPQR